MDPEDRLHNLSRKSSGPKVHTQHFDRQAFYRQAYYGSLADQGAKHGEPFLNSFHGQLITKYLYAVNLMFAVVALVAIVAGLAIGQSHKHQVAGVIEDRFALICTGFGVCVLGFALLGCAATKSNVRCVLLVYFVVLLLHLVVFGALMVTEVAASNSADVKDMVRRSWEALAEDGSAELCDLQHTMRCSGFTSNCSGEWSSNASQYDAVRPLDCPDCASEADSHYPRACWDMLQVSIRSHLRPLVYISFGALIAIGLAVVGALYLWHRLRVADRGHRLYDNL